MKMLMLLFGFTLMAHSKTQVFEGSARYEGKLVFRERHVLVTKGARPLRLSINYLDPQGRAIGRAKADFTQSVGVPDYILEDLRHQSVQSLRHKEGKLVASYWKKGDQGSSRILPAAGRRPQVAGPGLPFYILQHLDEILRKGKVQFDWIMPGRLDSYEFSLVVLKQEKDRAELEVRVKNWAVRIFSSRFKLIFDLERKRLVALEGLSPLRNSDGNMFSVDITYDYQD